MIPIPHVIARAASTFGDATAVSDGRATLSFRAVHDRSNRLANALLELSPERSGRVAILTPNRLESVELDFAIAKSGKVRVPVNTRLSTEERVHILRDSGAETLVFDASEAEFVAAAREQVSVRHLVALGAADLDRVHRYDALLAGGSASPPSVAIAPDDPSFILYTSGTTGRPKGATATQSSRWAATISMLTDEIDAAPGDAMVHVGSMAHGSGSKVLAYFLRGARNIAVDHWDPERFLALVERERATASFLVPTMISMLIEARRGNTADLSSLKTLSYGGAPIAPALLREALATFGEVFVQVYGSCEAPHPVLVMSRRDHHAADDRRLASVGREVAGCRVMVAGSDGEPLGAGVHGEMWIQGDNVMRGYWNNPAATHEVLVRGWYRSGDVATHDGEGFFTIVDRERDMIISGGLNVYPAEIEAALHRHPAVLDCAVFGVPDEKWGEAVCAAIVLRAGAVATEAEIVEHCRPLLAGYKKPRRVEFHEQLPKGATGKTLKRALRDPHWAGQSRAV
jgi:acyl-CoA synthetase (AMP-forming)/AMP-acid ligase II